MDFVTGFCLNFKADCYKYQIVHSVFSNFYKTSSSPDIVGGSPAISSVRKMFQSKTPPTKCL
ncbi:hypothetical protein CUS_6426 [Ruminococcus albus 8]|uniref:Uncharacterized protein n=1 Tax=Ruminococcus albus 8 TaxID=246199 RepID=E9S9X5_RUMAL|nr:hypothetical protein CUS_6426 [Ruminococcus albus 8]